MKTSQTKDESDFFCQKLRNEEKNSLDNLKKTISFCKERDYRRSNPHYPIPKRKKEENIVEIVELTTKRPDLHLIMFK